jgi:hypothetical protein
VKVKEKLFPVPIAVLENFCPIPIMGVASFTIVCEAESMFVQMTVVPLGTVTEAGLKAKFRMVTAAGGGGTGVVVTGTVVAVGVVAAGIGVVAEVVRGVVTAGGAGGAVVPVVAAVVTGPGPEGAVVQPAAITARRTRTPVTGYHTRGMCKLMETPHGYNRLREYKGNPPSGLMGHPASGKDSWTWR